MAQISIPSLSDKKVYLCVFVSYCLNIFLDHLEAHYAFSPGPLLSALVGGGPGISSDILQLVNDDFELLCLDSDQEENVSSLRDFVEKVVPAVHRVLSEFLWIFLEPIFMEGRPAGLPFVDSLLEQSGGYLNCSFFKNDHKHWLDRLITTLLVSGYSVFSFIPGTWFVCHPSGKDLPLYVHKIFKLSSWPFKSFSRELTLYIEDLSQGAGNLSPSFFLKLGKVEQVMAEYGSLSLGAALSLASSRWKWDRDIQLAIIRDLEILLEYSSQKIDANRMLYEWRHAVKIAKQEAFLPQIREYFDHQPVSLAAPHGRDLEIEYQGNKSLSLSRCVSFITNRYGEKCSTTYIGRLLLPPRKNSLSAYLYSGLLRLRPLIPAKNDHDDEVSPDRHYCAALLQYRRLAYGALPWPIGGAGYVPLKGGLGLARDDKARIYTSGSAVRRPSPVYCEVDLDGIPHPCFIGKSDFQQVRDDSVIAQGILVLDARLGKLLPDTGLSSRNSGTSLYILRDGKQGQGAAQHLAELFYAFDQSPSSFSADKNGICTSLFIICDGGAYEHPTHKSVLLTHIFLRYIFRFRSLSICTNAGGCSDLSPAERPHSVVSRCLSGEPLNKADPLRSVRDRLSGATFSGKPLKSFILEDWQRFIPAELIALTEAKCLASTKQVLGEKAVTLPLCLQQLLRKLSISLPPLLYWKDLLQALDTHHGIKAASTCVDLISCGCTSCGGLPSGGLLEPRELRLLEVYPIPDVASPGHYLSFFNALALGDSADYRRGAIPDSYLPSKLLKETVKSLFLKGASLQDVSAEQVGFLSTETLLTEKSIYSQLQMYFLTLQKKSPLPISASTTLQELQKQKKQVLRDYLLSVHLTAQKKEKKEDTIKRVWNYLQNQKKE